MRGSIQDNDSNTNDNDDFRKFVEVAIVLIYKLKTRKKLALSDFQLDVVRALLEEFGTQKLDVRGRPSIETPVRITARHFPSKVQSSEDGRRRCFVCSHTTRGPKRETKANYECKECNVGSCVVPCFEAYHTLKHFK